MFRVLIEHYDDRGPQGTKDIIIKTEKMYELLGRFMHKYGIPHELVNEEGCREIEYHKAIGKGFVGARVSYAKISDDENKDTTKQTKSDVIQLGSRTYNRPPAEPEKPNEERVQALVDSGAFKKAWS